MSAGLHLRDATCSTRTRSRRSPTGSGALLAARRSPTPQTPVGDLELLDGAERAQGADRVECHRLRPGSAPHDLVSLFRAQPRPLRTPRGAVRRRRPETLSYGEFDARGEPAGAAPDLAAASARKPWSRWAMRRSLDLVVAHVRGARRGRGATAAGSGPPGRAHRLHADAPPRPRVRADPRPSDGFDAARATRRCSRSDRRRISAETPTTADRRRRPPSRRCAPNTGVRDLHLRLHRPPEGRGGLARARS